MEVRVEEISLIEWGKNAVGFDAEDFKKLQALAIYAESMEQGILEANKLLLESARPFDAGCCILNDLMSKL